MTREKEIESYLVWAVEVRGGKAFKTTSVSNRGFPDRVVCMPDGTTHFVELKSPTGRRSKLQIEFGAELCRLNQSYVVLSTQDEVDGWLLTL